jgi:hypothetical protein
MELVSQPIGAGLHSQGPEAEDQTLYASHTVWENRAVFEAWTSQMHSGQRTVVQGTTSRSIRIIRCSRVSRFADGARQQDRWRRDRRELPAEG